MALFAKSAQFAKAASANQTLNIITILGKDRIRSKNDRRTISEHTGPISIIKK